MKILSNIMIFIYILLLIGCQQASDDIHKKEILKVGVSAEYPPFEFQQGGKTVGFDIDLIEAVASELGMKAEIQDMSFHSLISALQTNKIDVAISGMTITPERQKNVDFTDSYYQDTPTVVFIKEKANLTKDLTNKKLGVQLGSTPETWAKQQAKLYKGVEIISLDANPLLIEKLKLGQIDYVVIGKLQAIEFCKANPALSYVLVGQQSEGYGIALAKNSSLTEKVNQAILKFKKNGYLQQLETKWIGA